MPRTELNEMRSIWDLSRPLCPSFEAEESMSGHRRRRRYLNSAGLLCLSFIPLEFLPLLAAYSHIVVMEIGAQLDDRSDRRKMHLVWRSIRNWNEDIDLPPLIVPMKYDAWFG